MRAVAAAADHTPSSAYPRISLRPMLNMFSMTPSSLGSGGGSVRAQRGSSGGSMKGQDARPRDIMLMGAKGSSLMREPAGTQQAVFGRLSAMVRNDGSGGTGVGVMAGALCVPRQRRVAAGQPSLLLLFRQWMPKGCCCRWACRMASALH